MNSPRFLFTRFLAALLIACVAGDIPPPGPTTRVGVLETRYLAPSEGQRSLSRSLLDKRSKEKEDPAPFALRDGLLTPHPSGGLSRTGWTTASHFPAFFLRGMTSEGTARSGLEEALEGSEVNPVPGTEEPRSSGLEEVRVLDREDEKLKASLLELRPADLEELLDRSANDRFERAFFVQRFGLNGEPPANLYSLLQENLPGYRKPNLIQLAIERVRNAVKRHLLQYAPLPPGLDRQVFTKLRVSTVLDLEQLTAADLIDWGLDYDTVRKIRKFLQRKKTSLKPIRLAAEMPIEVFFAVTDLPDEHLLYGALIQGKVETIGAMVRLKEAELANLIQSAFPRLSARMEHVNLARRFKELFPRLQSNAGMEEGVLPKAARLLNRASEWVGANRLRPYDMWFEDPILNMGSVVERAWRMAQSAETRRGLPRFTVWATGRALSPKLIQRHVDVALREMADTDSETREKIHRLVEALDRISGESYGGTTLENSALQLAGNDLRAVRLAVLLRPDQLVQFRQLFSRAGLEEVRGSGEERRVRSLYRPDDLARRFLEALLRTGKSSKREPIAIPLIEASRLWGGSPGRDTLRRNQRLLAEVNSALDRAFSNPAWDVAKQLKKRGITRVQIQAYHGYDPTSVAWKLVVALNRAKLSPRQKDKEGNVVLSYRFAGRLLKGVPDSTTLSKNSTLVAQINDVLKNAFLEPQHQKVIAQLKGKGIASVQIELFTGYDAVSVAGRLLDALLQSEDPIPRGPLVLPFRVADELLEGTPTVYALSSNPKLVAQINAALQALFQGARPDPKEDRKSFQRWSAAQGLKKRWGVTLVQLAKGKGNPGYDPAEVAGRLVEAILQKGFQPKDRSEAGALTLSLSRASGLLDWKPHYTGLARSSKRVARINVALKKAFEGSMPDRKKDQNGYLRWENVQNLKQRYGIVLVRLVKVGSEGNPQGANGPQDWRLLREVPRQLLSKGLKVKHWSFGFGRVVARNGKVILDGENAILAQFGNEQHKFPLSSPYLEVLIPEARLKTGLEEDVSPQVKKRLQTKLTPEQVKKAVEFMISTGSYTEYQIEAFKYWFEGAAPSHGEKPLRLGAVVKTVSRHQAFGEEGAAMLMIAARLWAKYELTDPARDAIASSLWGKKMGDEDVTQLIREMPEKRGEYRSYEEGRMILDEAHAMMRRATVESLESEEKGRTSRQSTGLEEKAKETAAVSTQL